VYAFGLLWIIFAQRSWMLVFGYVLAGLGVGADVPASWTLIAETAPAKARGKMAGVAQVLWMMGPVVVLLLAFAMSSLGVLGIRIIFGHLFVLALVLWAMRRGLSESKMWEKANETARSTFSGARELFSRPFLGSMLFLAGMYGFWNLMAGTNGFYLPYILRTVGNQSQGMSVGLQAGNFVLVGLGVLFVFMPLVDRTNQKRLFMIGAVLQILGMLLFALFPLGTGIAVAYVVLLGVSGGFSQQPFFQLWSGEMFPTHLRSTAQGVMFAVVRIGLGIWSFFVPALTKSGFHTLAWILTGFLVASALLGLFFAPSNAGKTLDELHPEAPRSRRSTREPAADAVATR